MDDNLERELNTTTAKYEQRYCAFIDFLGFADVVEKGSWSPDKIISSMKKAARISGGDKDLIRVTQFSDSLILSTPVNEDWAFLTLVSTAFFLIIELVQDDVLLRGGITKGDLYHQDNLAFGPAFIRAYRLEQAASTPRIILDPGLFDDAVWPESMDDKEINFVQKKKVPKDADGWRYVDYFSQSHVEEFDDGQDGLEDHYATLNNLIESHKNAMNPSIRTKYGWLEDKLSKATQKSNRD